MYYVKFWLLFIFLNNTLIFGFGYDKIEEQETLGKILREEVHIMGGKFGVFLESLLSGEFDFSALGQFFANINHSIMANSDLMGIWNAMLTATASITMVVPIIFIALGAIEWLFGKKLIPLQRFLLCAAVGYICGVLYISPLINGIFSLPSYISGAVVGLVAAVLCKFMYYVAYAGAAAYSVYIVSINGIIPFLSDFTEGNHMIALVAAAVAVIIAFILRKYIEMLGTAILGAFIISKAVNSNYFDYTALEFFGDMGWIAELAVIGAVGLIGFIIQIKTRRRY